MAEILRNKCFRIEYSHSDLSATLHEKLSLQQLYEIVKIRENIIFGLLLSLLFVKVLFIKFTTTKDLVMMIINILVL